MNLHPSLMPPTPGELAAFLKFGARTQAEVLQAIERRRPDLADKIDTAAEALMQERIHDHAMMAAVFSACAEAHGVNFFEAMLQAVAEIRGETSNPNLKPQ